MINKQILKLFRVTNEDYLKWCNGYTFAHYNKETKYKYYTYLLNEFLNN